MNERIIFIDVIKIVAMVCVVGLHTTPGFPVLYSTCSIAIPLFFMSTGFLMWDRNIGFRYIIKKALLIARFVIIANLIYWIFIGLSNNSWNVEDLFKGLSVTGEQPFWQFWFLGSLLFVYALFPLLQQFKRYALPIIIVLSVLLQGVFIMNLFGIQDMPLEKHIPQAFRMHNWIFYSLLGGGGRICLEKLPNIKLWHLIIALIINSIFQYVLTPYMNDIRCEYFYPSVVVIILCIMIFKFLSQFEYKGERLRALINELSKTFLPVYTIHIFLVHPVSDIIRPYTGMLTAPIRWPIVLLISLLLSYVLVHTKYVKSLLKI